MQKWLIQGLLVLLAGCSGTPVKDVPATVPSTEKLVELKADNYSFTPTRLSVPANTPVVIRIHDESRLVPHAFVLEGLDGKVIVRQSLSKSDDTMIRLAPMPAGTYVFYCDKSFLGSSHRAKGMEGKLEVTPATAPPR